MPRISQIASLGFTLLLAIVVPILSYSTARNPQSLLLPRVQLYFSAAVSQWLITILGGITLLVAGTGWASVGLRALPWTTCAGWTVAMTVVALAFMAAMLPVEQVTTWPAGSSGLVERLIPRTSREKLWAGLLVAPTAGFCEEFLYRGFLLRELSRWFPSGPWAVGLSCVAFGLAHCYQGLAGVASAALLGLLLAYPVRHLGTLYPSMAAHALADAVALVWMIPKLAPLVEARRLMKQGKSRVEEASRTLDDPVFVNGRVDEAVNSRESGPAESDDRTASGDVAPPRL